MRKKVKFIMEFKKGNIDGIAITKLIKYLDERGFLIETFRNDALSETQHPQMSYISYTESGIGRGPHEHEAQTDIFVFLGPGNFKIYLWDNRKEKASYGNRMIFFGGVDSPIMVIIPPGIIHGYKNISKNERGMVLNYPNKLYAGFNKKEKTDEIRHEDKKDYFYQEFITL